MGDITKIDVDKLEPVDIICAGSPCQDLSVAGKREGLAGERSGLFVDAIKLVHGLRERTGKPRFFVWENVPGAFSSNKGMDFRAVLEEISQTQIPMPKNNKWAESGVVEWCGGSLAWRVLDAQYWGVPQRRKRIFLVADFAGQSAGEILFKQEGLPRDIEESQGEGKEAAENAGTSIDRASGIALDDTRSQVAYSFDSKASNSMKSKNPYSGCRQVEVSKTLDTTTQDPSKNQGGIAIYDISHRQDVIRPQEDGTLPCLTARAGTGGNNLPVVHSYCIAGNTIDRQPQNGGNGTGNQEELAYTLNTIDRHAVAYSMGHDERSAQFTPNKTDPLTASDYKQPPIVGALCARDYKGLGNQCVESDNKAIYSNGKVRRLTPTECERLQGLPDGECFVLLDLKNEKVVFIRWLEYQKSPVQYAEDKCHKKQRFVGIAERSRLLESVLSAEKNLHSSNPKINKPVRKSAPINSEEYVQVIHSLWEWLRNACSVGKNLETHLQKQNQNSVQNVLMNIEKESITHNGETEQQSKERTIKKDECGANALEQFGKEIMELVKDAEKPMTEVVEGSQFIIFDLTEIAKKQGMLWTILSFFAPNVMHTLILRQGNTVALSIGTKGYTDIEFKGKPAPDSKRYKSLGNGMAQPCANFVIERIVEVTGINS